MTRLRPLLLLSGFLMMAATHFAFAGTAAHHHYRSAIVLQHSCFGFSFSFESNGSGGDGGSPLCFVNKSNARWDSLELDVPAPDPILPIIVESNAFNQHRRSGARTRCICNVPALRGPGLPNGTFFTIDIGTTGWTPNATFQTFVNPEPGTIILFLTGLAPVLWRRRFFLR